MGNSTERRPITRNEAIAVGVSIVCLTGIFAASVVFGPEFDWGQKAAELGGNLTHQIAPR